MKVSSSFKTLLASRQLSSCLGWSNIARRLKLQSSSGGPPAAAMFGRGTARTQVAVGGLVTLAGSPETHPNVIVPWQRSTRSTYARKTENRMTLYLGLPLRCHGATPQNCVTLLKSEPGSRLTTLLATSRTDRVRLMEPRSCFVDINLYCFAARTLDPYASIYLLAPCQVRMHLGHYSVKA